MVVVSSWVALVFYPEPDRWGLRGDPYLWAELHDALDGSDEPGHVAEFHDAVERLFQSLVGVDLNSESNEPVAVDRYPGAGMSGGFVDPRYWREVGVPLLESRLDALILYSS